MIIKRYYTTNKYFADKINTDEYIVLHHTWPWVWMALVKYLANSPTAISCHYVVIEDWTIYQIAEDTQCTWHAGISEREWKKYMNYYSIWIEIVSDWYNYTDKQRIAVRELVNYLIKKHNLTPDKVIRHKDISPWRKS